MTDNPFEPPSSDVDTKMSGHRSVWWKVYFYVITTLTFFSFLGMAGVEGFGSAEIFAIVLEIPAMIGLFGFAFTKRVATPAFWRMFFVVYLTFSVAYYFLTDMDISAGLTPTENLVSQGIGWLIVLPGLIALYLYGNPSDKAWQRPA